MSAVREDRKPVIAYKYADGDESCVVWISPEAEAAIAAICPQPGRLGARPDIRPVGPVNDISHRTHPSILDGPDEPGPGKLESAA